MKPVFLWLRENVDAQDCAVLGGLVSATIGIAQIHRPTAWIFVGVFFMWYALRRNS